MDVGTVLGGVASAAAKLGGTLVLSQLANLLRIDHPLAMNFAVSIDGFIDAGFVSCDGIDEKATPYEIKQCNLPGSIKIYPYKKSLGSVTLAKGITFQGKMEEWYYDVVRWQKGDPYPLRDVSIIQLLRLPKTVPLIGGQLIEVARLELPNCACRGLSHSGYDANSDNKISILKSVVECTTPQFMGEPSRFGDVGILIDALMSK